MTMDSAQGPYNDKMDESLGMRHRGSHSQSMKDRRDEASAMDKMHSKMGRKYDDVMTMDSEHHKGQGYNDELDESLGMSHKESGMRQSMKDRRDESKELKSLTTLVHTLVCKQWTLKWMAEKIGTWDSHNTQVQQVAPVKELL